MNSLFCLSASFEAGVKLLPFCWDSSLYSTSSLCWYTQQHSVWCSPSCYRYGWVPEKKAGAGTEDRAQGDSHLRWTCVFYCFLPWLCKSDQDVLNTQWAMLVPGCLTAVSNELGVIQCNHWHLEGMTISFLFSFLFLITFALFFLSLLRQIGCSHRASGYVLPESCVLVQFLKVKRKTFIHFPF